MTLKKYGDRLNAIKFALERVPRGFYSSTCMVLHLLATVALQSDKTKMNADVLAKIFTPCFLRPSFHVFFRQNDAPTAHTIVSLLIIEYDFLIKNTGKLIGSGEKYGPAKFEFYFF